LQRESVKILSIIYNEVVSVDTTSFRYKSAVLTLVVYSL
jgi:hypothetical protein